MNLRFIVAMGLLAAGQSGTMPTSCLAEPSATPVLRIHVYDLASVPERTLRRALAGATRVFAATGIELAWESGKTDAPEAHTLDMSARPTSGTEQADGREKWLRFQDCRSRKLRIVGRHSGLENLLNGSRTVKTRKH